MSTEQTSVEPQETNLDDFAAELFGQSTDHSKQASEEEQEVVTEESDASTEDTHADEADTLAPDNDDDTTDADETDVVETDQTPKPKKNRFQERIDQLTRDREEEKRARLALEARLEELANKQNTKPEPVKTDVSEDTGPKPTDVNEDGTEKYPLGEFDPLYIKDLMRHTLNEESHAREEEMKQRQEQEQRDAAQAELQTEWNNKLVTAKERYPDFETKGQEMLGTFESIDPAYGEYLTNTIMEMEYGPDVFYYLSSHIDEARDIVNSGAKKATIALGRLEAKFAMSAAEQEAARPRVSNAPPPPEHINKGSAVAKPVIRGDEKDVNLDDFAKALFKGSRR